MNDKLIIFAALKSFYDAGQDLLGVFGNLVLLVISGEEPSSISKIKTSLNAEIKFDIPKDVLHTIVKRLKKNNFVEYSNIKDYDFQSIKLTPKGKELEEKVRKDFESATREKNSIIKSLKAKHNAYSEEVLLKELNIFIENSTGQAVSILEGNHTNKDFLHTKVQLDIVNFFIEAEKSDPESFQRLKAFLYGKIISNAFLCQRFTTDAKIEKLSVYLDTNIVFSLMGFHEESYNSPVKEVANLIKQQGGVLKVFSFTFEEVKNKLRGFLKEYGFYSSQIPVGSIYYTLKRKNFSKFDVISLIENLEQKLKDLGVEIDYIYNQDDLIKEREEHLSKLSSYKPLSPLNSVKYDLAALFGVKKLRGNKDFYLWEKSIAIFLSADHQLVNYDFIEHGHKEFGTFPEVVSRSDMASFFWLKGQSGSDNIFLHNLFSSYIRNKVISTNLWNKFTDELKKRREVGILQQEDIERIISLSETEVILREQGEVGIKEILNDENIKQIKEISAKKDKSIIENEDIIFAQANQLTKINDAIIESCKTSCRKIINALSLFISIIIILLFCFSIYKSGLSVVANILQAFGILFIVFLLISILNRKEFKFVPFVLNLMNNFENKLVIRCIENKKKKYKVNS